MSKECSMDIPDNVNKELERLHDMYSDHSGTSDRELQEWIRSKIDKIHDCYFAYQPIRAPRDSHE